MNGLAWGKFYREYKGRPAERGDAGETDRGSLPTTTLTHIAVGETLDGKVVDWLEKVSDEDYRLG